jgi:hypothetical protein
MWRWLKGLTNRTRPKASQRVSPPASPPELPESSEAAARLRVLRLLRSGHFWNDGPPPSPLDPESPVRSPRPFGPPDRITSAAVDEPQDDDNVVAVGGLAPDESIRREFSGRARAASRVH